METVNFMAKRFKTVGYTFCWEIIQKRIIYLTKSKFVIVPPGFDALAGTDSFSVKN
jgi:hypothetical protein